MCELKRRLLEGLSRTISLKTSDFVHLYFDASFEPEGYSGLGGVMFSSEGDVLGVLSEEVPSEVIKVLQGCGDQTIIQQLEALAILVGLRCWRKQLADLRAVIFTDSDSVKGALLRVAFCQRVVLQTGFAGL